MCSRAAAATTNLEPHVDAAPPELNQIPATLTYLCEVLLLNRPTPFGCCAAPRSPTSFSFLAQRRAHGARRNDDSAWSPQNDEQQQQQGARRARRPPAQSAASATKRNGDLAVQLHRQRLPSATATNSVTRATCACAGCHSVVRAPLVAARQKHRRPSSTAWIGAPPVRGRARRRRRHDRAARRADAPATAAAAPSAAKAAAALLSDDELAARWRECACSRSTTPASARAPPT